MIEFIDNMLRQLFMGHVDEIVSDLQVRFQPPNDDWRTFVANLTAGQNALNVYLIDLRENRNLRSNERSRTLENGVIQETPAPRRVDCHYLISAWSSATESPTVEATLAEHALLSKAIGALIRSEPIVARQVYLPNPLPAGFPAEIADQELPTIVLPSEGFLKLAEFWSTTGEKSPWKPVIYFIITIPVVQLTQVAGPMVTTRITEYRFEGKAETAETWIEIGATVLAGSPPAPLADAWVHLESGAGAPVANAISDADGRVRFGGLHPGNYTLRVRAPGHEEKTRDIRVPSPTGDYDVLLT